MPCLSILIHFGRTITTRLDCCNKSTMFGVSAQKMYTQKKALFPSTTNSMNY